MNIDQELIKDIADQGDYLHDNILDSIAARVTQDIEHDFGSIEKTTLNRFERNEELMKSIIEDYVDAVRDEVILDYEEDEEPPEFYDPPYDPYSYSPNYTTP